MSGVSPIPVVPRRGSEGQLLAHERSIRTRVDLSRRQLSCAALLSDGTVQRFSHEQGSVLFCLPDRISAGSNFAIGERSHLQAGRQSGLRSATDVRSERPSVTAGAFRKAGRPA